MQTHTAQLSRRGRRWKVAVAGQGKATAKVGTLGDAKRAAEAIAQQTLIWQRRSDAYWVGDPPTAEQQERLDG